MTITNPLSLEFLAHKPGKAAAVLQALDAEQAALYLTNVPTRVLAPVIERIESWPAARIIELMPLEQSCAVITQLKYPAAATLIRLLDDRQRQSLLAQLPNQLVRTLKRSLNYPEDSVGAWMDSSTPHFSRELMVGDCLALLKKTAGAFEIIVAVDDSHCIDGVIPLSALLTSHSKRPLGDLVDRRCVALAAKMSLTMAKNAADWQRYNALPVRTNHGVFVGAISRESLHSALLKTQPNHTVPQGNSLLAHVSRAMITTATGLLATLHQEKNDDVSR